MKLLRMLDRHPATLGVAFKWQPCSLGRMVKVASYALVDDDGHAVATALSKSQVSDAKVGEELPPMRVVDGNEFEPWPKSHDFAHEAYCETLCRGVGE